MNKTFRRFAMLGTIGIAVIFVMVSLGMWRTTQNVAMQLKIEQKTLEQVRSGIAALGFKTSAAIDPGDISFIRNEIQKKDITFVTLMKFLSSRTPKNVYLKSIEFGGEFLPEASTTTASGPPSPGAAPPPKPVEAAVQAAQKAPANEYPLVLKGYVFGEADSLELTLFSFLLSLKESGFIRQTEVLNKENKNIKGKTVMEFTVSARCFKHEL